MDAERLLRFESFELDVRSRELRKGKQRIRLQEQPFEILRLMLERPGDVVTREELAQSSLAGRHLRRLRAQPERGREAAARRPRRRCGQSAVRRDAAAPRLPVHCVAARRRNGARCLPVTPDYKARLAVLPFTNLSGDASQEYFSDGLTEEMILQLGRLGRGRIGVISRSSSNVFKGSRPGAREIGEALRADYLLEGSVRREGDRVRITAQLVETSSETHLWTDVYERHLTDCLSVQAEVAARIAQSLAVELLPEQPRAAVARCGRVSDVSEGPLLLEPAGRSGVRAGDRLFRPGVRVRIRPSPRRTPTLRARTRRVRSTTTSMPRDGARDGAADRASARWNSIRTCRTRISRSRISARCSTGIGTRPKRDSARRSRSIRAAMGRIAGTGSCWLASDDRREAVRESQRARELDPLCLVVGTSAAWTQYMAGDYQAAIETCRQRAWT